MRPATSGWPRPRARRRQPARAGHRRRGDVHRRVQRDRPVAHAGRVRGLVANHEIHYYVGQGSESFGGGQGSSAIASGWRPTSRSRPSAGRPSTTSPSLCRRRGRPGAGDAPGLGRQPIADGCHDRERDLRCGPHPGAINAASTAVGLGLLGAEHAHYGGADLARKPDQGNAAEDGADPSRRPRPASGK